ncbi:MAG: response regulator [Lautropia sp.]|nr:response regulator [Lautropia sp.]
MNAQPARKILIVDDSATERFFMSSLLSKQGYEVITAENGDEAIEKVQSERPAVVIMDVVMPGKSGFQATRAIARDPAMKDVHVILCTSKNAESDRIWGLRQGAKDYLVKPVDPEVLLAKISSLAWEH